MNTKDYIKGGLYGIWDFVGFMKAGGCLFLLPFLYLDSKGTLPFPATVSGVGFLLVYAFILGVKEAKLLKAAKERLKA